MASEAFPDQGLVSLAAGATLPVFLVTMEGGHIVDVRVATRDFLLANLAGEALTQHGGKACNPKDAYGERNAGDSRSRSG